MEQWIEYNPDKMLYDDYEVYEITRNEHGTVIKLTGLNQDLNILFGFVDSLRFTDEGRRIATYNDVEILQKYRENFIGNPIYKIENSSYIDWLDVESAGFLGDVEHYVIVTRNDIIDIVSGIPPRIEYQVENH